MLTFLKAQMSSLIASLTDLLMTALLVELAAIPVLQASVEGTITGGIVNFIINRNWVFEGRQPAKLQAAKYALVWSGNLLLNAAGMFGMTQWSVFPYIVSKVIVSILVGTCYNYFLQKRFVFKVSPDVTREKEAI
jgi:putative flippase GtrA